MSFPDDPGLLRRTHQFAAQIIGNEIPDDLQPDISNLLGFAKNFYLQFFAEEHGIEVSGFNLAGRTRARQVERGLRNGTPTPQLLLVSHYLTMAIDLSDRLETSDELDPGEQREAVLGAIAELLTRIAVWAETKGLAELAREAHLTYDDFVRAAAILRSVG